MTMMMMISRSRTISLALLHAVVALAISSGSVRGSDSFAGLRGKWQPKPTLTIYLFEQLVSVPGAESTNMVSATTLGNSSSFAFGNLGVSQQVIRESASSESRIIGRAPGGFAPGKENGLFNLQKLIVLKTDHYDGTFVVFSDFDSNVPSNEFAIVGGTGSFRLASGWATTTVVSSGFDHFIYKWDVFIK